MNEWKASRAFEFKDISRYFSSPSLFPSLSLRNSFSFSCLHSTAFILILPSVCSSEISFFWYPPKLAEIGRIFYLFGTPLWAEIHAKFAYVYSDPVNRVNRIGNVWRGPGLLTVCVLEKWEKLIGRYISFFNYVICIILPKSKRKWLTI